MGTYLWAIGLDDRVAASKCIAEARAWLAELEREIGVAASMEGVDVPVPVPAEPVPQAAGPYEWRLDELERAASDLRAILAPEPVPEPA